MRGCASGSIPGGCASHQPTRTTPTASPLPYPIHYSPTLVRSETPHPCQSMFNRVTTVLACIKSRMLVFSPALSVIFSCERCLTLGTDLIFSLCRGHVGYSKPRPLETPKLICMDESWSQLRATLVCARRRSSAGLGLFVALKYPPTRFDGQCRLKPADLETPTSLLRIHKICYTVKSLAFWASVLQG